MRKVADALNIDDLASMARNRLPLGLFEFIDRGAEDEITMRENRASIKRVFLRQRVGNDVSGVGISRTVFGVEQSMPVAIGVTGLSGILAYDGERSLARAAASARVPYTIGTNNFTAVGELKDILGTLLWRQIYPPKNRSILDHHLSVTRAAGIRVLVVTLDSPVLGNREYMIRNGFMPGSMNIRGMVDMLTSPRWTCGTLLRYLFRGGLPELADMPEGERRFFGNPAATKMFADDFTWQELRELRRRWHGVLVVKGISTPEDALLAAASGVDGIIVSNHGGRVLDGCIASMSVLPEIVDAVGNKLTVMIDGGFTRGADMLKAIALGASSVMVGRATLFGLAAGGQEGVLRALTILRTEISRALALCGSQNLSELTRDLVRY